MIMTITLLQSETNCVPEANTSHFVNETAIPALLALLIILNATFY